MVYTPTSWNEGVAPGISAAQLNRMEDGIEFAADGVIEQTTFVTAGTVPSAYGNYATTNFTIPTNWNTWDCHADALFQMGGATGFQLDYLIRIDGVDSSEHQGTAAPGERRVASIRGWRLGLVSTGAVQVNFRCQDGGDGIFLRGTYLHAIARRKT